MSKGSKGAGARNDYDEDIAEGSDGDVELRDADELNGDESGSSNEDSSEVYIVESILDHNFDEDDEPKYQVKWKGYEKPSERTWEAEEQFVGARGVLEAYWKKIGGKPVRPPKAAASASTSKKRGRASTASEAKATPKKEPKERKDPAPKRQRQSLGRAPKEEKEEKVEVGQASNEAEDDKTPEPVPGYIEVGTDDWRPPKPTAGAWDKHIQAVDTIEKDDAGKLWAYLLWTQQNADGYFYRNKAKLETCYVACPQRMLQFYEKHVVFTKYKAPK